MNFYGIEDRWNETVHHEFRFYSLYNGMRGKWYSLEKDARAEGLQHEILIDKLLNHVEMIRDDLAYKECIVEFLKIIVTERAKSNRRRDHWELEAIESAKQLAGELEKQGLAPWV